MGLVPAFKPSSPYSSTTLPLKPSMALNANSPPKNLSQISGINITFKAPCTLHTLARTEMFSISESSRPVVVKFRAYAFRLAIFDLSTCGTYPVEFRITHSKVRVNRTICYFDFHVVNQSAVHHVVGWREPPCTESKSKAVLAVGKSERSCGVVGIRIRSVPCFCTSRARPVRVWIVATVKIGEQFVYLLLFSILRLYFIFSHLCLPTFLRPRSASGPPHELYICVWSLRGTPICALLSSFHFPYL
jgi:hypothetical protein